MVERLATEVHRQGLPLVPLSYPLEAPFITWIPEPFATWRDLFTTLQVHHEGEGARVVQ